MFPTLNIPGLGVFKIKYKRMNDDNPEEYDEWLEHYKATIIGADKEEVGRVMWRSVNRLLIYRGGLQDELEMSEYGGMELEHIGRKLFDKNGDFLHEDHGTFNAELNLSNFAVIAGDPCHSSGENMYIKPGYRGHGLGSWLLSQIYDHSSFEDISFAFVWPTVLDSEIQSCEQTEERQSSYCRVLKFFQKNGFRKVDQSSGILGYAIYWDDHVSRMLPMESDKVDHLIDPASQAERQNANAMAALARAFGQY
ncbi:hypothetical protein BOTBODRAFT_170690 [Botryobasidium botryosum FD-172 SS1]|uniref:N-acetyltransferase domain-containing protein n=1 Tax=Botryobasidium botryosum (strain FD-172 SS1) TaxID=930990 RepID=A0A067N761_BOTB1|nr:hypothetical protein BOTBODRAFT_170690 [Botryobasidium botryosum FD-172 SS1]